MLAAIGSAMIAAGEWVLTACTTASGSFQGTTTVSAAWAAVTPGLAGTPTVATADPASASRPSEWPW